MIKIHPHPPAITEDESVSTSTEFISSCFRAVVRYLPALFNDDLPVGCTIKTSGHVIVTGWEMEFADGDDVEHPTPAYLDGLEGWYDGNLLGYWEEGVQHVGFIVPMSDKVVIQTFSATGESAWMAIDPGPFPGSFAYSPVHNHLPPGLPDGEYDVMLDLIKRSGRHLWGKTWTPIEGSC